MGNSKFAWWWVPYLMLWGMFWFAVSTVTQDAICRSNGYYDEGREDERMLFDAYDSSNVVVNPRAFSGAQK